MKITAVYCGPLSPAQQSQFGTTAAGGLIYKYANTSSRVTGSAKLFVGFTANGSIAGSNYAGSLPDISPGKSGEAEVDAVGVQGQDLSFSGCEMMSYALVTATGVDPVSYAG